jgi:hypothetical protein
MILRKGKGNAVSKYDPLQQFLQQSATDELTLGFAQVEQILGDKLPASAFQHRAWWGNDQYKVQSIAWSKAGWKVDAVDQNKKWVRFRRVKT